VRSAHLDRDAGGDGGAQCHPRHPERERRRLLVVVGPCSVHDPPLPWSTPSALAALREKLADRLEIVMRSISRSRAHGRMEGPDQRSNSTALSTSTGACGWRANVLSAVNNLGLPAGTEFLT